MRETISSSKLANSTRRWSILHILRSGQDELGSVPPKGARRRACRVRGIVDPRRCLRKRDASQGPSHRALLPVSLAHESVGRQFLLASDALGTGKFSTVSSQTRNRSDTSARTREETLKSTGVTLPAANLTSLLTRDHERKQVSDNVKRGSTLTRITAPSPRRRRIGFDDVTPSLILASPFHFNVCVLFCFQLRNQYPSFCPRRTCSGAQSERLTFASSGKTASRPLASFRRSLRRKLSK